MITAPPTPKNIRLIERINDIEMDLAHFHRTMSDDEIDKQLEKVTRLCGKLER